MLVYFNGKYLKKSDVVISPDDRGFLFADGVYEVVHAYGGRLFRWEEHLRRLVRSLTELRLTGLDLSGLEAAARRLLAENGLEQGEASVYIQITRGAAPRSHRFPAAGTPPTVYMEAKTYSPPNDLRRDGAMAIIVPDDRWARCDIKTVNLLANTLAHQRAWEAGAFEAIFSHDGVLVEGTHSSILFARDGVLLFPPQTNRVLPSVTRNVVASLAAKESIATETRTCFEREAGEFQEILMLGTMVEIVPIVVLNGQKVGEGVPGPLARRLQDAFRTAVSDGP
jgi:D-alanine transaminase